MLTKRQRRFLHTVIALALGAIFVAVYWPRYSFPRSAARKAQAMSNLKQVSIPLLIYAGENNDSWPPSARWADLAEPYAKTQRTIFRVPETEPEAYSVAFMRRLGGTKPIENEAERQALVYETTDTKWNANHNFTQVWWHRHRRTAVVFVDGHAREFRYYDPNLPAEGTGRLP